MTNKDIIEKGRKVWCSWHGWKKQPDSCSFTSQECKIIRKCDYKCCYCGTNIFELDDFPEFEDGDVVCENCFTQNFEKICVFCEESYRKDENKEMEFPKSAFYYDINDDEHKKGIYESLAYPVFSAAVGGVGTTLIDWDNVRLVVSKKEYLKDNPAMKGKFDGGAEFICKGCYQQAKELRDKIKMEVV